MCSVDGRILVGVDGSEGSRRALGWALSEAALRRTAVEAVAVWQSPYDALREYDFSYPVDEAKLAAGAREHLERVVGELADVAVASAVEVEAVVLEGDPAEVLCRRAAEAALLVLGARGQRHLGGLRGSVSARCAQHCPRPLVIVPTERAEPVSSPPAGA